MKLILAYLFFMTNAFAVQAPYQPWSEGLIKDKVMQMDAAKMLVGDSNGKAAQVSLSGDVSVTDAGVVTVSGLNNTNQAADGVLVKKVVRATYDFAEHGGATSSIGLGVSLPAKALITQAYFYMLQQPVDAGSGTMALTCEDAGNIFNAADITGITVGTVTSGVATGAAAAMVKAIGAACEVTATIAGAALTAGKFNLYIEYVVHD